MQPEKKVKVQEMAMIYKLLSLQTFKLPIFRVKVWALPPPGPGSSTGLWATGPHVRATCNRPLGASVTTFGV